MQAYRAAVRYGCTLWFRVYHRSLLTLANLPIHSLSLTLCSLCCTSIAVELMASPFDASETLSPQDLKDLNLMKDEIVGFTKLLFESSLTTSSDNDVELAKQRFNAVLNTKVSVSKHSSRNQDAKAEKAPERSTSDLIFAIFACGWMQLTSPGIANAYEQPGFQLFAALTALLNSQGQLYVKKGCQFVGATRLVCV